jgi:hypothetical protein
LSNPDAVVGTLPELMLIVLFAQAGDPTASATMAAAPTRPTRKSSDDLMLVPFMLIADNATGHDRVMAGPPRTGT